MNLKTRASQVLRVPTPIQLKRLKLTVKQVMNLT